MAKDIGFVSLFMEAQALLKATVSVLQACSPTTRTHTATGSAALSAITILNSG